MQIFLETRDIQTRPVFTGNILRQPAMAGLEYRAMADGYPVADDVMRGGILLACHHGLKAEQLDYMHELSREFAKGFTGKRATKASAARSDLSSTSIGI